MKPNHHRRTRIAQELRSIVCAGLALITVATVLGFLSGWHAYFDWFADFREIYALCAIVPLVALVGHDRRATCVAAVVFCVNAAFVAPWAPVRPDDARCDGAIVAISVNAFGRFGDAERLAATIERERPALLLVTEMVPAVRDRIAPLFPHVQWDEDAPALGLFSRYPVVSAEILESRGRPFINALVETPDGLLRVIGAHPDAPFDSSGAANRNRIVTMIADIVSASPEPVVLLGDLNLTMFSPHYAPLEAAGLHNARRGRGVNGTWPTFSPLRIPIDHVMHTDDFATCSVEVGESVGSDHLPIIARFVR